MFNPTMPNKFTHDSIGSKIPTQDPVIKLRRRLPAAAPVEKYSVIVLMSFLAACGSPNEVAPDSGADLGLPDTAADTTVDRTLDSTNDSLTDRHDSNVDGGGCVRDTDCANGFLCRLGACTQFPDRCRIGACDQGVARSCDSSPIVIACDDFGAECSAQTDLESGQAFEWCNCGDIPEGDGRCLQGQYGIACSTGLGGLVDCGAGFECVTRPAGPFGIGCECNNFADGLCPDSSCSADPDCATCTPDCQSRVCGSNGCNGECGQCDLGERCTAAGACESECVPYCDPSWECGEDDCGNSCGTCSGGATCNGHQCEGGACVPDCAGRQCGSDGCSDDVACGVCTGGLTCSLSSPGQCECDFFATVTYIVDASNIDFTNLFSITVNGRHRDINDQPTNTTIGMRLTASETTDPVRAYGCRHNAPVRVDYNVRGGGSCSLELLLNAENIRLPMPSIIDGQCTVQF